MPGRSVVQECVGDIEAVSAQRSSSTGLALGWSGRMLEQVVPDSMELRHAHAAVQQQFLLDFLPVGLHSCFSTLPQHVSSVIVKLLSDVQMAYEPSDEDKAKSGYGV